MTAVFLPLAHHALLTALPFVVPMVVVVAGLLVMAARDRIGGRGDAHHGDPPRSHHA